MKLRFAAAALLIVICASYGGEATVILPDGDTPLAAPAVTEDSDGYQMEFGFFIYSVPAFSGEKLSWLEAEHITILDQGEDGWVFARTSAGDHWLNRDRNMIYTGHYINTYEDQLKQGKYITWPPGEYPIIKKGRGDWFLLETKEGQSWADVGSIPAKLGFIAPVYEQMVKHPNGCESYAATIALNMLGNSLTPSMFIAYVPQGLTQRSVKNGSAVWGDPDKEFVGSMTGSGYAVNPPVLVKAVNDNFSDVALAEDISGADYGELTCLIAEGRIPLIWFLPNNDPENTSHWLTHEGKKVTGYYGTHTVALIGYDLNSGTVLCSDSIGAAIRELKWADIELGYELMGSLAMAISPVGGKTPLILGDLY